MTTRKLVDQELLPLIELLPAFDFSAGVDSVRGQLASQVLPSTEGMIDPYIRHAQGRDGAPDVPIYVFDRPGTERRRPAILHVHGGGMVLGTAAMSQSSLSPLVEALDVVVLSIEYRLAPETPFPGPQEDCYAALAWLNANSEELRVDPDRVILMGESAGGGLAAALAIMVRDRGEFRLAGQVLTCPMLDCRTGGADDIWRNPTTGEFVWNGAANQFGWESLRGDYAANDSRKGWFSPALEDDLSGLPRTFIAVGALDLFLDESLDYARRLVAAGVPVDLDLYAGTPHAFGLMQTAGVTERFRSSLLGALERFTGHKASATIRE